MSREIAVLTFNFPLSTFNWSVATTPGGSKMEMKVHDENCNGKITRLYI